MFSRSIILLIITATMCAAQVNFVSSNLPIVIIDTAEQEILDEPKIEAHMGIIFSENGNRNYITHPYNHYNGNIGIEIRGSSSQNFPKKSYSFETRDENGENLNVPLLGMPVENDWILYAPYSDKSLIRNILAYKLSNDMGRYASRTKFVELVLNGEYLGVYVLLEKIKRDNGRIDINSISANDNEGIDITGGYIFKIDKFEGAQTDGWESTFAPSPQATQRIYYQYHYPEQDDITEEQKQYLQSFVYNYELAMSEEKFNHPFDGYPGIIDIDSFVDYYILNEFCRNVDEFRLSTYMYKDRDDVDTRLKTGPIWDFNLSFGNANYYKAFETEGWQMPIIPSGANGDDYQIPFWWKKLAADKLFLNSVSHRWSELRHHVLSSERINKLIDSLVDVVEESSFRNFNKWKILGQYVWPNYNWQADTYGEEIEILKSWIEKRLTWFDGAVETKPGCVDWSTPENLSLNLTVGTDTAIPKNNFFNSLENIEEITFESNSVSLIINTEADNVIFHSDQIGVYQIRGLGWKDDAVVSVSLAYNINVGITSIDETEIPQTFELYQNYPNPFNPTTKISFSIPALADKHNSQFVILKVYNTLGSEVATLVNEAKQPGKYEVEFDGGSFPSGVYFYRLSFKEFTESKKMILLK